MSHKQVARNKMGEVSVGLIGIRERFAQRADSHANQSDAGIQAHMVEQLGGKNYIPSRARKEYGGTFLREFCKMMDQPCHEEPVCFEHGTRQAGVTCCSRAAARESFDRNAGIASLHCPPQ